MMIASESEVVCKDFSRCPWGAGGRSCVDAVVMLNGQHNIVAASDAVTQMFGRSRAELLGQPLTYLIVDNQHEVRECHPPSCLASKKQLETKEEPVLGMRADGRTFPAEMSLSRIELLIDEQPRVHFVVMFRDLSVEHDLRAQVAMLTARMRSVINLVPVPLWMVDDGRVVFANRATADLVGVADGGLLVGKSIETLVQANEPESLRVALEGALTNNEKPTVINGTVQRFDGQDRKVEIVTNALPDHGKTALQMAVIDVTESYLQAREQAHHRQELQRLAARLVEAREAERRHIARELHDELGQRLSALKIEVANLRQSDRQRTHEGRIDEMLEMVDSSVAALRRIAADLRPLMLDDLGLNSAIESLAREAARRMGIEVTVRLDAEDATLTPGADIALYRMVQEALTNVGRHAHATDVRIDLRRTNDELVLTVQDNGKGFPAHAIGREGRCGLLGMRERAVMVGGRLEIDNPAGGGGRVIIHLPLQCKRESMPLSQ